MRKFMNGFNPAQRLTLAAFSGVAVFAAICRLAETLLGEAFRIAVLAIRALILG